MTHSAYIPLHLLYMSTVSCTLYRYIYTHTHKYIYIYSCEIYHEIYRLLMWNCIAVSISFCFIYFLWCTDVWYVYPCFIILDICWISIWHIYHFLMLHILFAILMIIHCTRIWPYDLLNPSAWCVFAVSVCMRVCACLHACIHACMRMCAQYRLVPYNFSHEELISLPYIPKA